MSNKHICNEEQRHESKKLLLKICSNILSNPNTERYKRLNYNKISDRLSACHSCISLLTHYGFHHDVNSNTMIFDSSKITELQQMKNMILSGSVFEETHFRSKRNYDEAVVQQLVDLELGTREECIQASSKVVNYKDIQEVAEQLQLDKDCSFNFMNSYPIIHSVGGNIKQYKCVCGKSLIHVKDQSAIYLEGAYLSNARVQCDICKHTIAKNAPFWHCKDEYNEHHAHGFDACDLCICGHAPTPLDEEIPEKESQAKPLSNPFKSSTFHKSQSNKDRDINKEVKTISILNIDTVESTIAHEELISNYPSFSKYIISDDDAELLILVEFKEAIDLKSVKLFALSHAIKEDEKDSEDMDALYESSQPKLVHIYKTDHINVTFDDIKCMKPDISIKCKPRALHKGKIINLKKIKKPKTALKFKKIRFLTIFIESNQNDTDTTYINGITFKGTLDDHEKHKILIKEDVLATTTLNQSVNKSRWSKGKSDKKRIDIKHNYVSEHAKKQLIGTQMKLSADEPIAESQIPKMSELLANIKDDGEPGSLASMLGVCSTSKCDHLRRLIDALKKYHQFIECNVQSSASENASTDINTILSTDYNQVALMNDFHHLINKHRANFEVVYNTFIKLCNSGTICDLSRCVSLRRNHRNRDKLRSKTLELQQMYFNHENSKDISLQQILDKIHCYYFHSFDIGYKHTESDRNDILQRAQRKHDIESKSDDDGFIITDRVICEFSNDIQSKKDSYQNIEGLEEIGKDALKFSSIENGTYGIGLTYKFGVRFFYWPYYKHSVKSIDPANAHQLPVSDNKGHMLYELYVEPKFSNIKQELIHNEICTMNEHQWNVLLQKAKTHIWTEQIRAVCSRVKNAEEIYNLSSGQSFGIHHAIALMVYCNFDKLQYEFSKTCRLEDDDDEQKKTKENGNTDEKEKQNTDQEEKERKKIQSLIERHRNYAHLGRLLRECVECFVITVSPFTNPEHYERRYFHGISKQSSFSSMIARIYTPFSTSAEYTVALGFAQPNGMILELEPDRNWFRRDLDHGFNCETDSFECMFVSDFVNEQEVFFFGGMGYFAFQNIQTLHGKDYRFFVAALTTISFFFYGSHLYFISVALRLHRYIAVPEKLSQQLGCRLILHELHRKFPQHDGYHPLQSITDYAQSLVSKHFDNLIYVEFFARSDELLVDVCNALFFDKYGWLELDVVLKIFPAVRFLVINKERENDTFCEYLVIYESVLFLLKRAANDEDVNILLQSICIYIPNEEKVVEKANKIVSSFKAPFKQLNWDIFVFDDSESEKGSSYIQMEPVFCDSVMTFLRECYQSNRIPNRAILQKKRKR